MDGRGKKAKGAAAEREVIEILNRLCGTDLKRNLEQVRGAAGTTEQSDLSEPLGGCSVEIKRQEKLVLNQWLIQCKKAAGDNYVPVLIFRPSREDWRVLVELTLPEYAQMVNADAFSEVKGATKCPNTDV